MLTTNQKVVFSVATAQFSIRRSGEKLFINRVGNGQLLDTYNIDTDPMDYVAEAITEMFLELCPVDIETDEEVQRLSEEVYLSVNLLYTLRDFELKRKEASNGK